jgi:outer membrane protein assembly factor BamB
MMRVTWRFLTRQGPCPPLIALLLTCSAAACAAPFSNRDTPLALNTPIVYSSTEDGGSLVAISGHGGSPLWHTSVGNINWAPTIAGDAVYATAFSHKTFQTSAVAVRLRDGKLLWQTPVPSNGYNPLLFSDGQTIVVDSGQAGLTGLDPSDGAIRWSKQVRTVGRGVLRRGVYYISLPSDPSAPGESSPTLAAYRASDGVKLWKAPIPISSGLVANENMLFANSGPNTTVALSQEDGHQLWSNVDTASLTDVVGASPRMTLVNEQYKPVDALDAMNGHALWSAASADFSDVGDRNDSVRAVADLIIGPQYETLIALHERDGAEAWRVQFQGFPYISMPGVRDGVLFVYLEAQSTFFGSAQPQIAALDAATGAVYWRIDAPHAQGMARFSDAVF